MRIPKQEKVPLVDALMLVPLIIGTTLSVGSYMPLYEVLKAAQNKISLDLSPSGRGIPLISAHQGKGINLHPKFVLSTKGNRGIAFDLATLVPDVLAAVLYYAFKYDPVGTVKPGWTDQLG